MYGECVIASRSYKTCRDISRGITKSTVTLPLMPCHPRHNTVGLEDPTPNFYEHFTVKNRLYTLPR